MSEGDAVSDQTIEMPDRLAAAARAELSAIQVRLVATWDVEAGLRDILLEEHYHQFIADQEAGFDVEAGLNAALAADAPSQNPKAPIDRQLQSPLTNALTNCPHREADTAGRRDASDHSSTIDEVWTVAQEVESFLRQFWRRPWRQRRPARHLKILHLRFSTAVRKSVDLAHLAVDLEQGTVSLAQATEIVDRVTLALTELSTDLSYYLERGLDGAEHPDLARIWELARRTASLEQPIKRLFEPSNDVVDALG